MKTEKNNTLKQLALMAFAGIIMIFLASGCNSDSKPGESEKTKKYSEQHRNQIHFSPDSMWMNDPNGMFYYDGEYHLFYQHNPDTNVWAPMHWGHAVSKDLVHWEHLPIALYPDDELGMIFSGSGVVDHNNTSGLGSKENPPLIAIFTHHDMEAQKAGAIDHETQSIAYSLDRGRTWKKYENNPVIENPGIKDFRDPKVFWHEDTEKWVMILAAQDRVRLYGSPDLKNWEYLSEFGKNSGAHGGVWECPDLFALDVNGDSGQQKWVMLLSINPGGPNGGSATQYFVGDFDGKEFTWDEEETKWIDWGKDNYAGVTWSDIPKEDGRRIFMGWMSNWQYANIVPTQRWRNAMTLPRKVTLTEKEDGYKLIFRPVKEIDKLRNKKNLDIREKLVTEKEPFTHEIAVPSEIIAEFTLKEDSQFGKASEYGFIFSNTRGEEKVVAYNTEDQKLKIDRSQSGLTGFSEDFPVIQEAPLNAKGSLKLHIYLDKASVEIYADDGKLVMTSIMFPAEDYNKIKAFSKNGNVYIESIEIFDLKSSWNVPQK
jgi:fructan beta-fructosidase